MNYCFILLICCCFNVIELTSGMTVYVVNATKKNLIITSYFAVFNTLPFSYAQNDSIVERDLKKNGLMFIKKITPIFPNTMINISLEKFILQSHVIDYKLSSNTFKNFYPKINNLWQAFLLSNNKPVLQYKKNEINITVHANKEKNTMFCIVKPVFFMIERIQVSSSSDKEDEN